MPHPAPADPALADIPDLILLPQLGRTQRLADGHARRLGPWHPDARDSRIAADRIRAEVERRGLLRPVH